MSDLVPTTDEIRYRVEHDWEPYGEGSFDRWLTAHGREVAARAWGEGFVAGVNHDLGDWEHPPDECRNPYERGES